MTTLYESNNTIIYKTKHKDFENEVIVKIYKSEYLTNEELESFNNEYNFIKSIDFKSVRKVLKKDKFEGKNALILEYFDGIVLKKLANKDMKILINIACDISLAISAIHEQNIIHKDINPNNILINSKNEIRIIDFGLASKYSLKTQSLSNPKNLKGTLAYISPEQTGRMNRRLDYRSDFYSLGVTFYEMFTGKLPFEYKEAMKLVHAHIAKLPKEPHLINSEIPKALSYIILKLMSKNAEDRYQSAFGLAHDLKQLLKLEDFKDLSNFRLAEKDFSGRLTIPEKLYGRENEQKKLLEIYQRINKQATKELFLVAGYSGVGKSVLVHEIHKSITENQGIYIEGKFDQFQKDIPYYALKQAFSEFIHLLINETDEKLLYWKNLIQDAVGNIGKILTDLVPDFELIIGKQAEIPELDGEKTQNRFYFLLQSFFKAISTKEHPLVLFIDDMQWADNATIKLLKIILLDTEIQYFMCINAYRDNETDSSHHFILLIEELKEKKLAINKININRLKKEDANNLVISTLQTNNAKNSKFKNLTDLVFSKTQGNAFFTIQFIKTLYEKELLKFNFKKAVWEWDILKIKNEEITNNVIELLTSKIQKLPHKTLEILKIAACVGNIFNTELISAIGKNISEFPSPEKLYSQLEPAIMEEAIIPLKNQNYKFVHDRIQQAVYSTIPKVQQNEYHLKIGRFLLKEQQNNKANLNKYIFDIVNQINYGLTLISNESEKIQFAELNILAAEKAKKSSAYLPALNYFETAKNLLGKKSWQKYYDLSLKINEKITNLHYLIGQYEKTKEIANYVIKNATNLLDKINVYYSLIFAYRAEARNVEAVEIGLEVIEQLGNKSNKHPNKVRFIIEFLRTKLAIGRKSTTDLANLSIMTDKYKLAEFKITESLGSATYSSYPKLYLLGILMYNRIIIKNGNSFYSPIFYSAYGILSAIMGKIDKSIEFFELAQDIIPKYKAEHYSARIHFSFNFFTLVWKIKIHEIVDKMYESYKLGVEIGDLEFAAYGLMKHLHYSFYDNTNLLELQQKIQENVISFEKLNKDFAFPFLNLTRQLCENGVSEKENPTVLTGEFFNEKIELEKCIKSKNNHLLVTILASKLNLQLFFNDFENIEKTISALEEQQESARGNYRLALSNFYISLASLQVYSAKKDKKYLKKALKNQKKMRSWAKDCSENYQHKYDLIQAEIMRIKNKPTQAREFYDKAIFAAKKGKHSNDEALSWQYAARFYLETNKNDLAQIYMQNAYTCYQNWGALAICSHLEQEYSVFSFNQNNFSKKLDTDISITTSSKIGETLDISSIFKASQSFSGEIKFEKLLKSIMQIIIENAGAENCTIIHNDSGNYTIEAESQLKNNYTKILQNESIENSEKLPQSILKYVIRTKKAITLSNAFIDKTYGKDKYISTNNIKSLLCYPIIYKNKLSAILYLENNVSAAAFTTERIEIINMLSSQIAISIENTLLYENLEHKVSERTIEINSQKNKLKSQAEELQTTNDKLIELDHFKENMTGMIVHDLKNPLNIILNSSKTSSFENQISSMKQSGRQMLNMVMNILDVSKYEETKMQLNKNDYSLLKLSQNAIDEVLFLAEQKNITIHNKITNKINVKADKDITERIFVNILTNAIKFTPNNGEINITLNHQGLTQQTAQNFQSPEQSINKNLGGFIQVRISDTGQGIPQNQLSTVFEKFGQVATKKSGKIRSTGLGLTFCKMAVEAHGGEIGVESELEKGTTFWFSMLLSEPENKETEILNVKAERKTETNLLSLSPENKKILEPFIKQLNVYEVYEISHIKGIIAQIQDSNEEIILWKKEINNCLYVMNEEKYNELIGII